MAAATADRADSKKDGLLKSYLMSNAVKIYKNTLVNLISASGYVTPGAAAAGEVFAGVAYEQVDNSAGAAGAKRIRIEKKGEYTFATTGATQATVGTEVYITDDSTVQTGAPGNAIKCGVVSEFLSATSVRVRIDNYAF